VSDLANRSKGPWQEIETALPPRGKITIYNVMTVGGDIPRRRAKKRSIES
jgi:hypothetical protein